MRWLPLALLLALPGAAMAQAEPATASPAVGNSCGTRAPGDTRPRIGLALGGGGARGFAHVSILRKLETLGIPVDCIAGTSAGALVGALYASGKTADEIEQVILGIEWKDQFNDTLPRQQRSLRRKSDDYARLAPIGVGLHGRNNKGVTVAAGFAQGQKLLALFEEETGIARTSGSFDDLPIPFRATATDLNTGKVVVLDHGSLAMAMRASMSLPGIFRPVEIDGKVLLDGGLANNVPVDVVRAMGAERIIAVDVGTPLAPLTRDASMLEVMGQLTGFLTTGNTAQQVSALQTADVLIKPALDGKVATADFEKGALAMEVGKEAADAASGELARLAVPQAQYARFQATHRQTAVVPPTIEFIKVDNETGYADEVLMSYLPVRVGEAIDGEAMQRGILRAYGLGTISSIYYQVVEEDGKTGVAVQAYPKPHGPVYVQAGLTLSNDLQGSNDANLRAGLLFAPISPYGAEARVVLQLGSEPGLTGEYYHPFDREEKYAAGVIGGYDTKGFNAFDDDGNKIARYRVERIGATATLFRNVSDRLALAMVMERYAGRAILDVGDPPVPDQNFQDGATSLEARFDSIDSLYFPRDGFYGRLGYSLSRHWLGADVEFDQLDFDTVGAKSFGSHAVQLGARYHATASGVAPLQSTYRLGGRWRLAGYQANELTGQHYALVFAGYTYELGKVLNRSAQVGGTLEYGNAWLRRDSMDIDDGILNGSVFIGFDSWVGPLIFGAGLREGGERVVFIELGQSL